MFEESLWRIDKIYIIIHRMLEPVVLQIKNEMCVYIYMDKSHGWI